MKHLIKDNIFNITLLCITIIVTLIFTISGLYIRETYSIKVNSVSPQKFVATETVKNEVLTNKLIEDARNSITPLYTHDSEVQDRVLSRLDDIFQQIDDFIIAKKDEENDISNEDIPDTLYMHLSKAQIELFISFSDAEILNFKRNVISAITSILEQGIREDFDKNPSFIKDELRQFKFADDVEELAFYIISSVLEPNLFVDLEATEKARKDKASEVEPIMILKNQKIIDEGEIVDEEIYAILETFGYIKESSTSTNIIPSVGIFIFIMLAMFMIFFYIKYYYKQSTKNELLLIFTLYTIVLLTTSFLKGIHFMLMPILLFTLLTGLLVNPRLAIVLNMFITLICAIIYRDSDLFFVFYYILCGISCTLISKQLYDRNKIMICNLLIIITNASICIGLTLFFDKSWSEHILMNLFYSVANSFFSFVLCLGVLPLCENIFGIVTTVRLLELINPDRKLMRKLLIEAPGTYHHSLIVANLSEAAAYDIGANPILARVGAYYHDIGKLEMPQYFSENVVGENLHNYLKPYDSAKILSRHVEAGLMLAEKNKLPIIIKDIIHQHHGTTKMKYFYKKATDLYSEENVDENDFRYKNAIPSTKESAIIMLADTAEAAVRSVVPEKKNMDEIEDFVRALIEDKLLDGQLKNCNLKIKDLDTILKAFMDIFKGMYHERISYPDEKKSTNIDEKNTAEEEKQ